MVTNSQVTYYLSRIHRLTPRKIVAKVLKNIRTGVSEPIQRFLDHRKTTYTKTVPMEPILRLLPCPQLPAESQSQLLFLARHYVDHSFDLLGSGWTDWNLLENWTLKERINSANCDHAQRIESLIDRGYRPIDWQADRKSGYRWSERTWYRDIEHGHRPGADIKVPRELGRMQHLTLLALAYRLTCRQPQDDPAIYLREFRNQILDFIAANPPRFGVHWDCTMDVAIRIAGWLIAYDLFRAAGATFDPDFEQAFRHSVYEHGLHITENLEGRDTCNHYVSNIAGLMILSCYLPQNPQINSWRHFCIQELVHLMQKQVFPDGTDFEASTCYHRLVLELFFYPTLLATIQAPGFTGSDFISIAEKIFGTEYIDRLRKMFDVVLHLLKPNGKMPQIGDNDSSRFFILYPRPILDMRYLLTLGTVFFQQPRWKIHEFFSKSEDLAEILIIYGSTGHKTWDSLSASDLSSVGSCAFPDSGWFVCRSDRHYCLISCGPNGQDGNGGHCHNDKLSLEVCLNGKDIIVDPGTYLYTSDPKARNRFRQTKMHNTVTIDNQEQNRLHEDRLFSLWNDARCQVVQWQTGNSTDLFIGRHHGYSRLKTPVVHQRQVRFDKTSGTLHITDSFTGSGKHTLNWNLILAPKIARIDLKSDKLLWEKQESAYSEQYGVLSKTYRLSAEAETSVPAEFSFSIHPTPDGSLNTLTGKEKNSNVSS